MKDGKRHFEVKEDECVGCNLCTVVCPVPECITLRDLAPGEKDQRTGKVVSDKLRQLDHHMPTTRCAQPNGLIHGLMIKSTSSPRKLRKPLLF
jgi:Fe-S-cluster-containing hydrogenase component 2